MNEIPSDEQIQNAIGEWAVGYTPMVKPRILSTQQDVGAALKSIRDGNLFRESADNFYLYCARRWGMQPQIVDQYISSYEEHAPSDRHAQPEKTSKKDGIVYFLKGGDLIKIGYTTDLDARVKSIQNMSPIHLEVLATMPGSKNLERDIHNRFSDFRVHGEWFRPSPLLMSYIEGARND